MIICAISDTHGKWNKLNIPECDILISAGDYSFRGEEHMVKDFHKWMSKQPARHRISVQGNHETLVESNFGYNKQLAEKACPGIHFIDEGLIEIEGVKIWCSAITPYFNNWAWNRFPGEEIKKHWDKIPLDIKVLITHGPPHGILDTIVPKKANLGCEDLLETIKNLTQLKLHIFGHIHGGWGQTKIDNVTFVNASICNEQYKPSNHPWIIALDFD